MDTLYRKIIKFTALKNIFFNNELFNDESFVRSDKCSLKMPLLQFRANICSNFEKFAKNWSQIFAFQLLNSTFFFLQNSRNP